MANKDILVSLYVENIFALFCDKLRILVSLNEVCILETGKKLELGIMATIL